VAKPWARIEIGYLNHPKFLALNANAICLWHEGKNYCDSHHTDGLIPKDALKSFRFRGAKSVESLLKSCGQKGDGTPYAPLWHEHPVGYKMHDYLDYNDCRDAVLARMAKADERRQADADRKAEWRAMKKPKKVSRKMSRRTSDGTETSPSRSTTETTPETETLLNVPKEQEHSPAPHPVKELLAFYEQQFEALVGEKPAFTEGRDAAIAKRTLNQFGPDKARALLQAFFASDDPFIRRSGYGLNIFAGQLNKLITDLRSRTKPEDTPDVHGHVPPCKTFRECTAKAIAEGKAAAAKVSA